jgi:hypothetical protein
MFPAGNFLVAVVLARLAISYGNVSFPMEQRFLIHL